MSPNTKRRTGAIGALLATGAGLALGLMPQTATAGPLPRVASGGWHQSSGNRVAAVSVAAGAEQRRGDTCYAEGPDSYYAGPSTGDLRIGRLNPGEGVEVGKRLEQEDGEWARFRFLDREGAGWVQSEHLYCSGHH
ncbi:SH3 domain-containing protein [Streptomyces sp. NPDC003077]|uniref:SH3 domain-containing protein n=1 Tax=Streptomyces sp. NPDC003077 TaxID=3154443 RepID=UPI0033AB3AF1